MVIERIKTDDEIKKYVFKKLGTTTNMNKIMQECIDITKSQEQQRIVELLDDKDMYVDTDIGFVLDKGKLTRKIQVDCIEVAE